MIKTYVAWLILPCYRSSSRAWSACRRHRRRWAAWSGGRRPSSRRGRGPPVRASPLRPPSWWNRLRKETLCKLNKMLFSSRINSKYIKSVLFKVRKKNIFAIIKQGLFWKLLKPNTLINSLQAKIEILSCYHTRGISLCKCDVLVNFIFNIFFLICSSHYQNKILE